MKNILPLWADPWLEVITTGLQIALEQWEQQLKGLLLAASLAVLHCECLSHTDIVW